MGGHGNVWLIICPNLSLGRFFFFYFLCEDDPSIFYILMEDNIYSEERIYHE